MGISDLNPSTKTDLAKRFLTRGNFTTLAQQYLVCVVTIRFWFLKVSDFGSARQRIARVQSAIRNWFHFSGDFVGRVTPVPIPNTEVKPAGADGTARETAWESRKSPGLFGRPAWC